MQTFLPSTSFEQSARWLDTHRLNNQINEALIILRTLTGWYKQFDKKGWPNHPATKAWIGYERALVEYCQECLRIYCVRIENFDNWATRFDNISDAIDCLDNWPSLTKAKPPWLTEEFASNHRSILLGKAYEIYYRNYELVGKVNQKGLKQFAWYQQFNWSEKPAQRVDGKWPYLWPERS